MNAVVTSEKYILATKELHFGHIKETFRAGAVIEVDSVKGKLVIDGRRFDDVRDLDILKRQAVKNPLKSWIVPFSEEALEDIRSGITAPRTAKKTKPGENMEVVKSDEDSHDDIDISGTQVSKRKAEAKDFHKKDVKSNKMEIIRGDETVEERIASLKGKNDAASIGERARLKAQGVKMPVVQDDSLGMGVSPKTMAMNAGQVLPSREAVEARTEDIKALAEARKKEAEMKRKVVASEDEEIAGATDSDLTVRPVTSRTEPEVDTPVAVATVVPKKPEVDAVSRENAELKDRMAKMEAMIAALTADKRQPVEA